MHVRSRRRKIDREENEHAIMEAVVLCHKQDAHFLFFHSPFIHSDSLIFHHKFSTIAMRRFGIEDTHASPCYSLIHAKPCVQTRNMTNFKFVCHLLSWVYIGNRVAGNKQNIAGPRKETTGANSLRKPTMSGVLLSANGEA